MQSAVRGPRTKSFFGPDPTRPTDGVASGLMRRADLRNADPAVGREVRLGPWPTGSSGRVSDREKGLPAVAGWAGAGWRRVDILFGVGILAVLLFPVGARCGRIGCRSSPPAGVFLAPLGSYRSGAIRSLPEFVTLSPACVAAIIGGGPRAETGEINRPPCGRVGLRGARRIERRPAPLSPVKLPAVAVSRWREESDLGALLIEVTAQSEVGNGPLNGSSTYGAGGRLALAVLNQAARGGGCAPRLNLAFLLAAEVPTQGPASVQRAFDQAVAACPDDPTALWALGEYQSVQVGTNVAAATFAAMERRFPRLGAAWSGAGDNALRRGYSLQASGEPFAARHQFARALALYRRAEALAPGRQSGRASLGRRRSWVRPTRLSPASGALWPPIRVPPSTRPGCSTIFNAGTSSRRLPARPLGSRLVPVSGRTGSVCGRAGGRARGQHRTGGGRGSAYLPVRERWRQSGLSSRTPPQAPDPWCSPTCRTCRSTFR